MVGQPECRWTWSQISLTGRPVRFGFRGGRPPHCVSAREWRNGRRAGFRCQCPKGRGGSNPPSRTEPWESPKGRTSREPQGSRLFVRPPPVVPPSLSSPDQWSADAALPHVNPPDWTATACLLYTSDAAD